MNRSRSIVAVFAVAACLIVVTGSQRAEARLTPGQSLTAGQCEYSSNGVHRMCLQSSGGFYHLAMNGKTGWCPFSFNLWFSSSDAFYQSQCGSPGLGTHTDQTVSATVNGTADMQSDGNFVLYTGSGGSAVWSTVTSGSPSTSSIDVQNDGNLVVYHNGSPMWSMW
jgi:hypothetical protein